MACGKMALLFPGGDCCMIAGVNGCRGALGYPDREIGIWALNWARGKCVTNILVTGGAGFIGSHLVPQLASARHKVRVVDNLLAQVHGPDAVAPDWLNLPGIEFHRGSVCDAASMGDWLGGMEVVVHLAAEAGTAQSMLKIEQCSQVNSQGTAVLLDAMVNTPGVSVEQVVLASSRAVYGEGAYRCANCGPANRLFPPARTAAQLSAGMWDHYCPRCAQMLEPLASKETDPVYPASVYAVTKLNQELLVESVCRPRGISYSILRLQNVYGPGQSLLNSYTGILSIFSTLIRDGAPIPLFEEGGPTRDFVHIGDVCRAFMAVFERKLAPNTVINVGSGVRMTVQQAASALSHAFGQAPNLAVTTEFRLGDIRHNVADIAKMKGLVGPVPVLEFSVGLREFADWVRTQPVPSREGQR